MPDWPKITIVTPSFNHAQYLEATLNSVLSQNYPNLEFIVMDGGSKDGTRAILEKYSDRLTYWESEKDRGQSHAINKGFARATGEIWGWLCSDDQLTPNSLHTVADQFLKNPAADAVAGSTRLTFLDNSAPDRIEVCKYEKIKLLPYLNPVWQPSCFFRPRAIGRAAVVMESLHYTMDHELWSYLKSRGVTWMVIPDLLSVYVVTGENKSFTGGTKMLAELEQIWTSYGDRGHQILGWMRRVWLPLLRVESRIGPKRFLAKAPRFGQRLFLRLMNNYYGEGAVSGLQRSYRTYGVDQAMHG